ncbi:MAG: galactokinase [Prevotellaceae bacterium]|jgi:galactokinase|nr:galactokinase [Prevotellaceae bacterium]
MDINLIRKKFKDLYNQSGNVYASPGRVNLIGEHTDYNLGFVLPGAIDKRIVAEIKPNRINKCRVYSIDFDDSYEFELGERPTKGWALYIYGVIEEIRKKGFDIGGFDCVFGGDIPVGAGLSSSAALESTFAFALNDIHQLNLSKFDLVKIGQMAEHNAVCVMCGVMDQFASVFGEEGKLIKLDCHSLEYEMIPFKTPGYRVVLINTKVKHSLASSEYNLRRRECEKGVAIIHEHYNYVESLRDVSLNMLDEFRKSMTELTYRRCSYVIKENQRLLSTCDALKTGNLQTFGKYMYSSHEGLSKDYEVSCPQLDFLVEIAAKDEVTGARMMGGGFGGCTINLIENNKYDTFINEVWNSYTKKFHKEPQVYDVKIGNGTRRIE